MSQIDELQGRIMTAMDRIAQGLDGLAAPVAEPATPEPAPEPEAASDPVPGKAPEPVLETAAEDAGEIARLTEALEEERLVTAQLEERIRTLKARHLSELEEARAATGAKASDASAAAGAAGSDSKAVAALDAEVQRLRKANDQLRESNAALREANEEGVGEPHLINKAMLAELESLRAARSVDRAEADAILDGLLPLLESAKDSQEEQA